jgi:hypothetical protein
MTSQRTRSSRILTALVVPSEVLAALLAVLLIVPHPAQAQTETVLRAMGRRSRISAFAKR